MQSQSRFVFEHAPGHLIRRAHQISVAVFAEETAAHGMTPVQFAILNALMAQSGIDQVTLAGRVAFDAATIGSVIGRLEKKGWLRRQAADADRRRKLLWPTPEGEQAVLAMKGSVARVQRRLLKPLAPAERQQFVDLLRKLVTSHERAAAD
ncbi:MarR family winged helix-turn-helix transcriptional regulator [Ottowia sp.]|uniref:MarR family winged helix-turn-helix transcriptional regulator n=1 Tax=Ottowia sp. TaxID=1898956 RepID=UPI0039E58094